MIGRMNVLYTFVVVLSAVTVLFCSSRIMADPLEPGNELQAFLENKYPWGKIEISNVHIVGNIQDKTPELITVEKGPVGKGVFSFIFDNTQKVIVTADVRALDPVVKSKRPYRKGYVLQDEDVYLSEMDIHKMPKSAIHDPETVVGRTLKRSILADMVIAEEMIEKSDVVKKGKRVVLLINGVGFNITAAGEIKEKGYIGTQVKAMNLSSKKEVRGVLIDENTVKVEL